MVTFLLVLEWNLIILPGRERNLVSDNKPTLFVITISTGPWETNLCVGCFLFSPRHCIRVASDWTQSSILEENARFLQNCPLVYTSNINFLQPKFLRVFKKTSRQRVGKKRCFWMFKSHKQNSEMLILCRSFSILFQYIAKLFLGQNIKGYNLQILNKIGVCPVVYFYWHWLQLWMLIM